MSGHLRLQQVEPHYSMKFEVDNRRSPQYKCPTSNHDLKKNYKLGVYHENFGQFKSLQSG